MTEIIIYSKDYCPYCVRAKNLLKQKGCQFREIDVAKDPALLQEMIEKSGGRKTVPQIFINGIHVGGFDDLNALNGAGKLDGMLKAG
jgi:glutaredoxin 3